MFLSTLLGLMSLVAFAGEDCQTLFIERAESREKAQAAFECYSSLAIESAARVDKSLAYNRMSYLKFFIAEYHSPDKEELLLEAIDLAEKSLLLFGTKYSMSDYAGLNPIEKKNLAEALYNYGLTTARYIDIKGQWEAIKRMEDIKRSMNAIIRLKEETTAFYGAHRTLGIFHTKVPVIAGGKIELAKQYLETVIKNTASVGELSQYPANNIAYADLMYKLENKNESCRHLSLVASLNEAEVKALDNGLYFETMVSVQDAQKIMDQRKCPF